MRSWISPWKRTTTGRGEKWNLEDLAGYIIIGIITRIIGFILRTAIISVGLLVLLVVIVGGFAAYALWIAMPVVIIAMIAFGIAFIFA